MRTFGERLKSCAKQTGGLAVLAERTGIPLRTIHNYTTGRSYPRLDKLEALAAAGGVSREWLLFDKQVDWDGDTFQRGLAMRLREVELRYKNRDQAARAAGISKTAFVKWINAAAKPSFEGLARLSRDAGVSLDWLAYGTALGKCRPSDEAPDGQ